MNNRYLVLIWNSALFCKKRIINDLQKVFLIEKQFYIKWDKEKYANNLQALYGAKMLDVNKKIKYIGKNEFLIIVVQDNNPVYKEINTPEGKMIINDNIYKRKWLYRKWTGGNFRVHTTVNQEETKHDLSVLLGYDLAENISSIANNDTLFINTKGIEKFESAEDLLNNLCMFGDNESFIKNNSIIVLSKSSYNVLKYLNITNNECLLLNNTNYKLSVLGEDQGELPVGMVDLIGQNKKMKKVIDDNIDNYIFFIKNSNKIPENIYQVFKEHNLENRFVVQKTNRTNEEKNLIEEALDYIKYIFLKVYTFIRFNI